MENKKVHQPDPKEEGQEQSTPQQPKSSEEEKEQPKPKVEDPPVIETPKVPGADHEVIP